MMSPGSQFRKTDSYFAGPKCELELLPEGETDADVLKGAIGTVGPSVSTNRLCS